MARSAVAGSDGGDEGMSIASEDRSPLFLYASIRLRDLAYSYQHLSHGITKALTWILRQNLACLLRLDLKIHP